jgi:hypothetical protein
MFVLELFSPYLCFRSSKGTPCRCSLLRGSFPQLMHALSSLLLLRVAVRAWWPATTSSYPSFVIEFLSRRGKHVM